MARGQWRRPLQRFYGHPSRLMRVGTWLALPIALLAGALVTVQAGSNAQLRQSFGSAMPALLVNYVLGFTVVLGYALIARVPWPATDKIGAAPWWAWIGGLSGGGIRRGRHSTRMSVGCG